ncbi:TetR/AcrR family transcriptional regulator [Nevskia soli]|uniref:TetR/AcrR family transcriptional regulator n=1 Tax=Nevskia soli TaxID=418856 RepID=UPI00055D30F6|nr:hypothetical protein [Nevskia soli]
MTSRKTASKSSSSNVEAQPVPTNRERVLAAAERLLARGEAEFSMRELAGEADLSFATPFNLFGSKLAIMRALSAERIATMDAQYRALPLRPTASARVLAAVDVAAKVMLALPEVNRAVMGAIGAPAQDAGAVLDQSRALWAAAIGDGEGLAPRTRKLALDVLPTQLALGFRGVLSFWTAGELSHAALAASARAMAATLLLGFVDERERATLFAEAIDTSEAYVGD